jgi:hypothetical protein
MPYRDPPSAPPSPPAPPSYFAGRALEALVGFGLFALAMSWVVDVAWIITGLAAVAHVTPTGHGLAQAFGP